MATIEIAGRSAEVCRAELSRHISTEEWIPGERLWRYPILTLHYVIEIELAGGGWDSLEFDPDVRIAVSEFPAATFEELVGCRLDELGVVSAWAGHDGGELVDVEVTLDSVSEPDLAHLSIRGQFTPFNGGTTAVAFTGPVTLSPITMRVKDPTDADGFFARVHGAEALGRAIRTDGDWWDLGESYPEDRRRWLPLAYRHEPHRAGVGVGVGK